jgi:hypothetical protein
MNQEGTMDALLVSAVYENRHVSMPRFDSDFSVLMDGLPKRKGNSR